MSDPYRPFDQPAGPGWLMVKAITSSGSALAVCGQTFTTTVAGPSTVTGTAAYISNIAPAGGAGASDVSIASPTTTVSSGAATWTAVLVRDPAGGGAGGVSTVTAVQGASGTDPWPVKFLAAQSVNAIQSGGWSISAITLPGVTITAGTVNAVQSGAWPVTQGPSGTQAWPVAQSGTLAVGAITLPVVSASQTGAWTANVNATAAISIAANQSLSAAITGTQTVSINGTANVSLAGQPIAVQPRATGNPGTVSFSFGSTTATSVSTTLLASSNGTKIVIKAYGVWNGDTAIHNFAVLNGASNSVAIPAFLAANAGGHNIGYPDPFPLAANVGLAVAVTGAIGTRGIVGYFEYTTVAT